MTPLAVFVTVFVADETALFAVVVTVSTTGAVGVVIVVVVGVVDGGGADGASVAGAGVEGGTAVTGAEMDAPACVAAIWGAETFAEPLCTGLPTGAVRRVTLGRAPRALGRVLSGPAVKVTCRSP